MVGEHPERTRPPGRLTATGGATVEPGDDRGEEVALVVAPDPLEDGGDPLQPHAGVHGALREQCPGAILGLVELHEDQVPDLDPSITTAFVLGGACGPPAGAGPAEVEVDLAVVTARSGGPGLPPVVLQTGHAAIGDADLIGPDVEGVAVVRVDRGPEPVRLQTEALGEQLPRHLDSALLEVVADRPVTEHLEEGVVGAVAHRGDVVGGEARPAEALLARGHPRAGRGALAADVGLEGHHSGHGEEQRRVVTRDQRCVGQDVVPALLEETEEALPDLVAAQMGELVGGGAPGGRWAAPERVRRCPSSEVRSGVIVSDGGGLAPSDGESGARLTAPPAHSRGS